MHIINVAIIIDFTIAYIIIIIYHHSRSHTLTIENVSIHIIINITNIISISIYNFVVIN